MKTRRSSNKLMAKLRNVKPERSRPFGKTIQYMRESACPWRQEIDATKDQFLILLGILTNLHKRTIFDFTGI